MSLDVFTMCNALYDLQAEITDDLLREIGLEKGSMQLLSHEEQQAIVPRVYTHLVNTESGGSGANTASGIALLGGTAAFTSRVGDDEHAELYREGLASRGVRPLLGQAEGATGVSLVLVSPDAQRTMGTYLGASQGLQASDLDLDVLRQCKYLYITGYLWDTENQKEAVLQAMRTANEAGVKVAFSLADPFCVGRHHEDFLRLLRDHVDLVIGNRQEAQAITGTDSPEDAARALAKWSDLAVVTLDAEGSFLCRGEELVRTPAYPVRPVDTTGAGDMFAAGILYGLTQGYDLAVTGRIASYAAAQVVAKMGPRIEEIDANVLARLRAGATLDEL